MQRLTTAVIRHRWPTVLVWVVLFVLGGMAAANLGSLLSNRFSVPGSDSEKGLNILRDRLHEHEMTDTANFTELKTLVHVQSTNAAQAEARLTKSMDDLGGKVDALTTRLDRFLTNVTAKQ